MYRPQLKEYELLYIIELIKSDLAASSATTDSDRAKHKASSPLLCNNPIDTQAGDATQDATQQADNQAIGLTLLTKLGKQLARKVTVAELLATSVPDMPAQNSKGNASNYCGSDLKPKDTKKAAFDKLNTLGAEYMAEKEILEAIEYKLEKAIELSEEEKDLYNRHILSLL